MQKYTHNTPTSLNSLKLLRGIMVLGSAVSSAGTAVVLYDGIKNIEPLLRKSIPLFDSAQGTTGQMECLILVPLFLAVTSAMFNCVKDANKLLRDRKEEVTKATGT